MLTAADFEKYYTEGYLLTPPMWPDVSVAALDLAVRELYADERKVLERLPSDVKELNRRRFFLHDLRLKSEVFASFIRSSPFLEICNQLLGPDVDTHYDGAIIKCAKDGHSIDWHQNEGLNVFGVKRHLTCF